MSLLRRLHFFMRAQRRAFIDLFRISSRQMIDLGLHVSPNDVSHPSQLCRCLDGHPMDPGQYGQADHRPNCEWAKQMCSSCSGTGWCAECQGDGCSSSSQFSWDDDEHESTQQEIRITDQNGIRTARLTEEETAKIGPVLTLLHHHHRITCDGHWSLEIEAASKIGLQEYGLCNPGHGCGLINCPSRGPRR